MSNFPWLQEKKAQAMLAKRKKENTNQPVHAGLGRDFQFSGNGSPKDVAVVLKDGRTIHNGELMFQGPGNGKVVTDAVTSRELLSNPVVSGRVGGNGQGFQTGGYADDTKSKLTDIGKQAGKIGGANVSEATDVNFPPRESVAHTLKTGDPEGVNIPSTATVPPLETSESERLRSKGVGAIENILETGGVAGRIGEKQLSDLKSTQDVERQVAKQESAQAGLSEDVAAGRAARLRAEHEGQLAETEAQTGIEEAQAKERAAGRLAEEGARESGIEIARNVQDMNQEQFKEYVREFDVGTEQWNKAYKENRRQYDNEDERWWSSFEEQRNQFDVGTEQWASSFKEQGRQFDVGTDQWNKVNDLRVKEFQRALELDKFSVDQWKDNVGYRDKAYLDTRNDADAKLEMERDVHEKNMDVIDLQMDITEHNAQTDRYWDGSERIYNYVSTHVDGYDEKTGELTWDTQNEMLKWANTKYPGWQGSPYDSVDQFKSEKPQDYENFKAWAASEWKSAADGRLTNPYDKMLYDVNSSTELSEESKNVIKNILTSPEALSTIAGINVDKDGNIVVNTNIGTEDGTVETTTTTPRSTSSAVRTRSTEGLEDAEAVKPEREPVTGRATGRET